MKVERNCKREECDAGFTVPYPSYEKSYCSQSCSAIVNNRLYSKRKLTKECRTCSSKIRAERTFCGPECYPKKNPIPRWERENTKEYMRNRYEERRTEYIKIMGGLCVWCGSTDNLEFDHVDRKDKSFDPSALFMTTKRSEILLELKKCQLLCNPCHVKKTINETALKT